MALSPYDQQVYDAGFKYVPQSQYLLNPFQLPQGEEAEGDVAPGLPAIYQARGGGGGGSYTGGVNDLIQNYTTTTRDGLYQSKLDKSFLGMPSYQQQQLTGPDLGEYIGTDTDVPLELTRAGKIQGGLESFRDNIGNFMGRVAGLGPVSAVLGSVDKFNTLSPTDQEFIKMNMGYRGPTVFGENTSGLSKDPYGINTRSAFGNYADYVGNKAAEYEDINDEEFKNLSKFQQTKVNFYRQKQKEYQQVQEQMAEQAAQRERDFAAQGRSDPNDPSRQGASGRRPGSGGPATARDDQGDRGAGQTGGYGYDSGGREGFGYGLMDGGRVGFAGGGMDASSDNFGGGSTGNNRGADEGGHSRFDAGSGYYGGAPTTSGGGGDNQATFRSPVDVNIRPEDTPIGSVPRFADLDLATRYGILNLRTDLIDTLKDQELDSQLNFMGNLGPVNINATADIDGNKSLGLGYNKGNFSANAYTDFDGNQNIGFGYNKAFADGGLADLVDIYD